MKPFFFVVIPAFNASDFLQMHLILFSTSYPLWECIVVDDGSTDNTLAIAKSYSLIDHRIKYMHQKNGGTGAALNSGIKCMPSQNHGFVYYLPMTISPVKLNILARFIMDLESARFIHHGFKIRDMNKNKKYSLSFDSCA